MRYLNLCGYLAIPIAYFVHWRAHGAGWEPAATFLLASLGVLPLAHLMGESTEHLSAKAGPTWGGLLNATFGNAAEFIIAIVALTKGLNEVVKASLTGSILGNLLLVGGAAMVAGGWRRERQVFNRGAAEANGGLLAVGVAAMLMPAIFHFTGERMHDPLLTQHDHRVSVGTSIILLIVYALGLLFTLRTHKHVFTRTPREEEAGIGNAALNARADISGGSVAAPLRAESAASSGGAGGRAHSDEAGWSVRRSMIMLLLASVGIGIVAELLVGSAESVAATLGWNHVFVGVILLAIVGNAAEHSTAVMLAMRDDMDTAMTITNQSSLQVALFVTPALVLISAAMHALGWSPAAAGKLDLVFTPMEVAAVVLTVGTVVILALNGESNWFEGMLLLSLYAILGVAFFQLPIAPDASAVSH